MGEYGSQEKRNFEELCDTHFGADLEADFTMEEIGLL